MLSESLLHADDEYCKQAYFYSGDYCVESFGANVVL